MLSTIANVCTVVRWEWVVASVRMRLMFAIYSADGSESGFAHLCERVFLHNSHTRTHTENVRESVFFVGSVLYLNVYVGVDSTIRKRT